MDDKTLNRPFIYFLITSNNHYNPNLFERDTISYRFNRNIAIHTQSRYVIAHLPKCISELIVPWPLSVSIEGQNYITEYINIELLQNNEEGILDFIKQASLGCVFVPDTLRGHPTIQELQDIQLPVLFLEDGVEIPDSELPLIIEKNSDNASKLFNRDIKISDKTRIEPIKAPNKRYIRPLQIAINRTRGLYLSIFDNRTEPDSIQNPIADREVEVAVKEALDSIKYYIKRLIVEKYIVHLACYEEGIDLLIKTIKKWDVSIDPDDLCPDVLEKNFLKLSEYFLGEYNKIDYRTDMVFVIPMVNKTSASLIFKKGVPKSALRKIYDFFGYTSIDYAENDSRISQVLNDRILEDSILDSLAINYSLGEKNPFVRLPNLPSSDITTWYSHMFNNVKRSSNLSEVKKFNTNFHNISTKMEMSLDEEIMEMIIKNGAHIKFITDSPIEWRLYKNVPIGVIKSISRLPIIPGNTLVVTAKNNFKLKIQKLDVSFLIINTINKGAPLYSYGKNLGKKLKEYFPKNTVKYYEITNKEDFIRIMNENLSTFFVYYGHGSMPEVSRNRAVQVGKLHIGSDELDMIELYERVKAIPTVTILGACQTQVLNSHYLNIGNMFLGLGSQSVLATYFPVDGLHTFSLIESIFRHLKNFFEGDVPDYIKKWSDIVLQARRTHYITEPSKSIVAYLDSKGDKNKIDILDLRKSVMEYCIINSYKANGTQLSSIEQAAIYRDEAYRKYFEKYSEKTREIVDYFFEQNYVFPESMLFTSLGSPEKIEFI